MDYRDMQRVYIEPTTLCNLNCIMCFRNTWTTETPAHMDYALFEKIIAELPSTVDTIFFGAMGEPLFHPQIFDMLAAAKRSGRKTEIITNGTNFTAENCRRLVDLEIDKVWVSIDGFNAQSYENIRSGSDFAQLIAGIRLFNQMRFFSGNAKGMNTELGLAFVLMKSNLSELKNIPSFASKLYASDVNISNVLPNTPQLAKEILYEKTMNMMIGSANRVKNDLKVRYPFFDNLPTIRLPYFDFDDEVAYEGVCRILGSYADVRFSGLKIERCLGGCRFVDEGHIFIRADGEVSPCMELLHDSTVYLYDWERKITSHSFGNIRNRSLCEIWNRPEYVAYRERVHHFDFPPCVTCGGCSELSENQEDCYQNPAPVCGACLWAQGLISCP